MLAFIRGLSIVCMNFETVQLFTFLNGNTKQNPGP